MLRNVFLLAGSAALLVAGTASAALIDDFESYADQAAFEAAWPRIYSGSTMSLLQGFGYDPGGTDPLPQSVHGVAGANSTTRNYRNLDSFTAYQGTDTNPVKFEFWLFDQDPSLPGGTGPRNFNEVRAYTGDGYGQGSLQGIIAMGLYNSPAPVSNLHARVYWGGLSAWYALNSPRKAGWTKMTALVKSTQVEFYVDDVLDTTVTFTDPAKNYVMDCAVLGSGLTSVGYDVAFDNFEVSVIPEPATLVLLAAGGILLRRRRA